MPRWKIAIGHLILPVGFSILIFAYLYDENLIFAYYRTFKLIRQVWAWLTLFMGPDPQWIVDFLSTLPNSRLAVLFSCWTWLLSVCICAYAMFVTVAWIFHWNDAWAALQKADFVGTPIHSLFQNDLDAKRFYLPDEVISEIKEAAELRVRATTSESYLDQCAFVMSYVLGLTLSKVLIVVLCVLFLPSIFALIFLGVFLSVPLYVVYHKTWEEDWLWSLILVLIPILALTATIAITLKTTASIYIADLAAILISGFAIWHLSRSYGFRMTLDEVRLKNVIKDLMDSDGRMQQSLRALANQMTAH